MNAAFTWERCARVGGARQAVGYLTASCTPPPSDRKSGQVTSIRLRIRHNARQQAPHTRKNNEARIACCQCTRASYATTACASNLSPTVHAGWTQCVAPTTSVRRDRRAARIALSAYAGEKGATSIRTRAAAHAHSHTTARQRFVNHRPQRRPCTWARAATYGQRAARRHAPPPPHPRS